jgi:hypothetical protein
MIDIKAFRDNGKQKRKRSSVEYILILLFINSSSSVDECAGVCTPASTTSLGNLSNCTLTFVSSIPGVWYAIALQVDHFMLIYILSKTIAS